MNRFLIVCLVLPIIALSGCAELSQSDHDVRSTATDWLALIDAHTYNQAFEAMVPRVRNASKEEDFVRLLQARRTPFGNAKKREFIQVISSRTMSGAPDGSYVTIVFKTKFEHKAVGYERVILTMETAAGRSQDINTNRASRVVRRALTPRG